MTDATRYRFSNMDTFVNMEEFGSRSGKDIRLLIESVDSELNEIADLSNAIKKMDEDVKPDDNADQYDIGLAELRELGELDLESVTNNLIPATTTEDVADMTVVKLINYLIYIKG